jgi:hypothetical protein
MRGSSQSRVNVAVLRPERTPDRWHGLDMADMVVLSGVSERDFTPEQLRALRDYVVAGGTLIVTGGINWNRLTTPFFAELLPVTVSGSRTVSRIPALSAAVGRPLTDGSAFVVSTGTAKAGADVTISLDGTPIMAGWSRGSGRVGYLAFDPALPPFRTSPALPSLWKQVLLSHARDGIIPAVTAGEYYEQWMGGMGGGAVRLADAPYAIPQLDIPAFYIVALFLLAYIVVLVPVNYFVLKAKDKKEYAWLTTPAIVLVFSVGAYMIGYGFKGGRTLLVRVGVIEARSGQDAAPSLAYAGLFSPRKAGYEVQLASEDRQAQADAESALLSEPAAMRPGKAMRVIEGDTRKLDDFAVDMWAMRVVKSEGIARLGRGFGAAVRMNGSRVQGTVTNNSPYALDDCVLVFRGRVTKVGALEVGKTAEFSAQAPGGWGGGTLLPAALLNEVRGNRDQERMRRAVLQTLCGGSGAVRYAPPQSQDTPMLVGWVREEAPVVKLNVNGGRPRELAATLMVVHLE